MKNNGYLVDAGVLQGLAKEKSPNTPLHDQLRREFTKLFTIREVIDECINVSYEILDNLRIQIEPTQNPLGPQSLLDAFSGSPRKLDWRIDLVPRADRSVFGHAIARKLDILTTDRSMKDRSYKEFLKRLDKLSDKKPPLWYLPRIIILQRGLWH